ncbi:hypothetical protein [Thermocoleostomius sinensis]|uniref:Uncharacterized protein n=1 Tax=Thermocoleostomius sinensis A174 TaxID=2016057 RepID=A0A9E8ZDN9_9CYAN|nr:hypothetical protein [Thermocoleostomius sinensis]WAL61273.1 hypothetical protein OXH18_04540 [Thermocoleostomius sinensis A174]
MNSLTSTPDRPRSTASYLSVIVPSCCSCAEFLPSDRTPAVGLCLLHATRVLSHDKACSQYDWDDRLEPIGDDDEF